MLVDKTENGDLVECLYKSSNILASEYNNTTKKLIITFSYGGKYSYENVDFKNYLRFEMDESQGKVFNKHIKAHKTENLGKVDTTELKTKLQTLLDEPIQESSRKDTT